MGSFQNSSGIMGKKNSKWPFELHENGGGWAFHCKKSLSKYTMKI